MKLFFSAVIFVFVLAGVCAPGRALDDTSPQVQIETKFVETTDNAADELGIDWAPGGLGHDHLAGSGAGELRNIELRPDPPAPTGNSAVFGDQVGVGILPVPPPKARADTLLDVLSDSIKLDGDIPLSVTENKGSSSEDGLAGLGEIPALGELFRGDDKSKEKQNLIIQVTPALADSADD